MKYRVTIERIGREVYEIEAQDEEGAIGLALRPYWSGAAGDAESRKEISCEDEQRFIVQEVRGNK